MSRYSRHFDKNASPFRSFKINEEAKDTLEYQHCLNERDQHGKDRVKIGGFNAEQEFLRHKKRKTSRGAGNHGEIDQK